MLIIPGVIDSTSCFVEHPEVVADRICRVAEAAGDRSHVIAGVDCGFGTFAGWEMVPEDIVWAKLGALRKGRGPRNPPAVEVRRTALGRSPAP
jgi:5-methyltetrahydropteroyltriglutamate--homocysteine methyltransferase